MSLEMRCKHRKRLGGSYNCDVVDIDCKYKVAFFVDEDAWVEMSWLEVLKGKDRGEFVVPL